MFWKNHVLRRRVRQLVTILLQLGALACIFPTQHPALWWWAAHAGYVALGYLGGGMVALIFNWPRLMFVCLGCSAVICFFHHEKKLNMTKPLPLEAPAAPPTLQQNSFHGIEKTNQ